MASNLTSSSRCKAKHKSRKEVAKEEANKFSETPVNHFHNFADSSHDVVKMVHRHC
ncbi:hypothetical protein BGZ60DRAFT_415180 [Tricladium varicosporioides]|nr:hypothetical protein BGZ60DRAFT_415180 [Hymenoscyphus varicosporioides]